MNVLLATSRGMGIRERLHNTFDHAVVERGAAFKHLTAKIPEALKFVTKQGLPTHVYVLAGSNDITEKLVSDSNHYWYTEVICVVDKDLAVIGLKQSIDDCARTIKSNGATPVFCTITNTNIDLYNHSLLANNNTSVLHHSPYYSTMQINITSTIEEINRYIIEINKRNNVSTPHCHSAIRKKRGRGKGYRVYDWSLLKDGLHATPQTKDLWAESIRAAIKNNDRKGQSDEEMKSPERSWKRTRRS